MEYDIDVTDVEAGTTVDQSECERISGHETQGQRVRLPVRVDATL
jgi:hypothetical protein